MEIYYFIPVVFVAVCLVCLVHPGVKPCKPIKKRLA
jgi:hypothetical protein